MHILLPQFLNSTSPKGRAAEKSGSNIAMGINRFLKKNTWLDAAILIVFIVGFTGATYNHASDIVRDGVFPYAKRYGAPEMFNIYWTSLILLDPFAIIVLCFNVRSGYGVALCIMLANVSVNLFATSNYWMLPVYRNNAFMMQTAFLMFLLFTIRRVWRLSATNIN